MDQPLYIKPFCLPTKASVVSFLVNEVILSFFLVPINVGVVDICWAIAHNNHLPASGNEISIETWVSLC